MKILFISKSVDNPTTRYRVLPLKSRCEAIGHTTEHFDNLSGIVNKLRILSAAKSADLIFVQRKFLPGWMLTLISSPVVYDFDDAIFCNSDGTPSTSRQRLFDRMIEKSVLVFPGNEYLASRCQGKARIIPTPVDANTYSHAQHGEAQLRLVWIGSRSTQKYLEDFRETLEAIGQTYPAARLEVVADFELKLESLMVVNTAWSPEVEVSVLATADIGIAPMTDTAWSRGKCALKVLQYMAASLPVISSDVGANSEVIEHGETGLLVTSNREWIEAIGFLESDDARTRLGAAGRKRLLEHFDQSVVVDRMIATLQHAKLLH